MVITITITNKAANPFLPFFIIYSLAFLPTPPLYIIILYGVQHPPAYMQDFFSLI